MGRMKDVCIQIMNENNGIPEGMTIADIARMKELEIYNWQEYEKYQERTRLQRYQQEDSGETRKTIQTEQFFEAAIKEARKEKRDK